MHETIEVVVFASPHLCKIESLQDTCLHCFCNTFSDPEENFPLCLDDLTKGQPVAISYSFIAKFLPLFSS